MARRKHSPENENRDETLELTSLTRVEERIERVQLTPEQAQERGRAAAATEREARAIDREVSVLKDRLKERQQAAASKHLEADQIMLDADEGTMASKYPVIVEPNPTMPMQMFEWRVPDGVDANDLVNLECSPHERIAEREAQGCIKQDERAMTREEIALHEKLRQLGLPLEGAQPDAQPAADGEPTAAAAGGDSGDEAAPIEKKRRRGKKSQQDEAAAE